ncbi:MAG: DUF86 domain-containing protein, partial [Acinetobacter sp.]|nr:DUF86 domain-containing protein [Acinetobacter sp.]
MNRSIDYIAKMIELCNDICLFVEGMDEMTFLADKRTQNAVAMSLIALGEVANKIQQKAPQIIDEFPHIAWKYMRGMRNVIAHGYFELDFVVV